MPATFYRQFRTAILFTSLWPSLSYLVLLNWRFGFGAIAFKLTPLLLMRGWCARQSTREHPRMALDLLSQTALVQFWLMVTLEIGCLVLLHLKPDAQGLAASGVFAAVMWAMHTVVGSQSLWQLWRQGCFRLGSSSNPK